MRNAIFERLHLSHALEDPEMAFTCNCVDRSPVDERISHHSKASKTGSTQN